MRIKWIHSHRILSVFLSAILLIVLPIHAQDDPPPILEILALVPDTARAYFVGYSDIRAAELARPGAAQPESFADLMELNDADDPAAALWLGALPPSGLTAINYLFAAGADMPDVMGFDFMAIDRAVTFGEAPAKADIYMGDFDQEAVDAALTGQGFVADELDGFPLWCSAEGCDAGSRVNVQGRNPANLFGGELGLQQPIVLTGDSLYSSRDYRVVEAITERANGEKRSLAEVPEYQTAVEAMTTTPDTLLRQAYFIHPLLINPFSMTMAMFGERAGNEDVGTALAELKEQYGELPTYRLLAFADYADDENQYSTVIMVYESAEDAQIALELIPQRIEIGESLRMRRPLKDLFDERTESLNTFVIEDDTTGLSAAVFEWVYDQTPIEPDETGLYRQPGIAYRFLLDALFARDTLWLSYDIQ